MVHPKDEIPFRRVSKPSLFCDTDLLTYGLHSEVWSVDWQSCQAYNVSVMAPFER
jgi:hypothetical protein